MSSPPWSRRDAWARMRAAAPPAWVLRHVACVEALAVAMARRAVAEGREVDVGLVQVGAVLHDLGRSVSQGPDHAHIGAEILRGQGAPESVVLVVERHTGAGLTADDARRIGIPAHDRIPTTLEQKIVAHADNLTSGDKRITMEQLQAKYEAKGLTDAWARIEALHHEMTALFGVDPQDMEPVVLDPTNGS